MWIFLPNSMLSIVEKPEDRGSKFLTVRARVAGDIESIFPEAQVTTWSGTDYAFRARVPREQVAKAMYEHVMNINYPNFKAQVGDIARHDAYMNCWAAIMKLQTARR